MSEIKAGDLVQCVASSDGAENYLECGKVYVVEGLGDVPPHMRPSLKLLGVDKRWSAGRFVKIEDAAVPVAQSPSEQISTDVQAVTPRFEVGDQVRCVNNEGIAKQFLSDGRVYVVRDVIDDCEAPIHLQLEGVDLHWCHDRFVKVEDAAEAEPAPPHVPSETVAVDTDRVQCTWWERNGFVYDELAQRWVLPPATERAALEADTQAAWDRFAAAAMKGLFAGDTRKTMDPDEVCRLAAECADEMLVRRAASRAAIEKGGA